MLQCTGSIRCSAHLPSVFCVCKATHEAAAFLCSCSRLQCAELQGGVADPGGEQCAIALSLQSFHFRLLVRRHRCYSASSASAGYACKHTLQCTRPAAQPVSHAGTIVLTASLRLSLARTDIKHLSVCQYILCHFVCRTVILYSACVFQMAVMLLFDLVLLLVFTISHRPK